MRIQRLADQYRLKIRRDECGQEVIPGRRGHLWLDGPDLCLTIIEGPPIRKSRLVGLIGSGGSVWLGDISPDDHGRRVQDAEVRGIRPERYWEAIRIVGCQVRKKAPGAASEVLARAREGARLKRSLRTGPLQPLERAAEGPEGERYQGRGGKGLKSPLTCA